MELIITNLSCKRGQQIIFKNLCFTINSSETLIITGENGTGKSSLLRLLTGLATPLTGKIIWCGKDIRHGSNAVALAKARTYQSSLHYLNHSNGIKYGLTIDENIQLTARLLEQAIAANYLEILDALKLTKYLHMQTSYLSAGQKRRVALCKLFLFNKPLWILDEPLTALDTQTQAYFYEQLAIHSKQGGIAIISSHSPVAIDAKTLRLG